MKSETVLFDNQTLPIARSLAQDMANGAVEIPPPGGDPRWRQISTLHRLAAPAGAAFTESQYFVMLGVEELADGIPHCRPIAAGQVAFGPIEKNPYFGFFELPRGINQLANKRLMRNRRKFWVFHNVFAIFGQTSFTIMNPSGDYDPVSSRLPTPSDVGSADNGSVDHAIITLDRFGLSNLSHFLFDCIGRALPFFYDHSYFCEERNYLQGLTPILLLPDITSMYHSYVLNKLNIPNLILLPGQKVFVKHLLVSTEVSVDFTEGYSHPAYTGDAKVLQNLRSGLVSGLREADRHQEPVYLSRADTRRRPVANEAEIQTWAEKRKVRVVTMSSLSAEEQLRMIFGANKIVGSHGAAWTNVIAAHPDTKVQEWLHPNKATDAYAIISTAIELRYDSEIMIHAGKDYAGVIEIIRLEEWYSQ